MRSVKRPAAMACAFPRQAVYAAGGALLILGFLIVLASQSRAADLVGPYRVIDGDTIEIAGERVRLHGIDAPERHQKCSVSGAETACGREATAALRTLAADGAVHCSGRKRDRYGRLIAVCYSGERDLNAALVAQGWALAYRKYSKDYVDQELEARTHSRGMWGGAFVEPWAWRRGARLPNLAARNGGSS